MTAPWLQNLNPAQERAVTHPPTSLQILAGPGSGKTRVLTCRVAYLIKELCIKPENLVVVTFTNKAANEMKYRLGKLLTSDEARRLVIGTFHSMAVQYLRKYGRRLDLKPNWVIADRDNQLAYCKNLLKEPSIQAGFAENHIKAPKDSALLEQISKFKSKGISTEEAASTAKDPYPKVIAEIYASYQDALAADNALDFDDLLLYGGRLFKQFPETIRNVEHVLIDEFQDTNVVQYNITKLLAHDGAVTIVGDPDQSIYLWRSAEVGNLAKMTKDFKDTKQIFLEENYRSSPAILKASLAVVEQDKERISKSLFTSHPDLTLPVLRPFVKPDEEANYIAHEIKRLIAHTGGQLTFNDFAILLRFNALSRVTEIALQGAGIPCRMVGGHKFFDRVEIKDIIAYLQLADNPAFAPAFDRVANVPKRGIGKVALDTIKADAKRHNIPALEVCSRALQGSSIGGLKPAQRNQTKTLVNTVAKVRKMAKEGCRVADMIDVIVEGVGYEFYLQSSHSTDADTRMLNIKELKTHAMRVAGISEDDAVPSSQDNQGAEEAAPEGGDDSGFGDIDFASDEEPTSLRHFLSMSMLSTDADTQDEAEEKNRPKVTISTCHAAKGLEWPVVFVPAVEDGIFPFYRCDTPEQIKEERRLLFVAMTRAQAFLYLTHSLSRMSGGETKQNHLSQFVSTLGVLKKSGAKAQSPFSQIPPELTPAVRAGVTSILARRQIPESEVDVAVRSYWTTMPPDFPIPDANTSSYSRGNAWGSFGRGGGFSASQPSSMGNRDIFPLHPSMSQKSGGYGAWKAQRGSESSYTSSQTPRSYSQPTTSQLNSGFSSALDVHRAPTASQAPTISRAPVTSANQLPAAPLATAPRARPAVYAATQPVTMPETRFSQGAAPALVTAGASEPLLTSAQGVPNLDSFQSSSKGFLDGVKSGLPPADGPISPATTTAPAGSSKSKGKKRLGTGRPAAGGSKRAKK